MAEETKKETAKKASSKTTAKKITAKKATTKSTATKKTSTKKSTTAKKTTPKVEKVVKEDIKEEIPVVEVEKVVEEPKVEETKNEEKKEESKKESTSEKTSSSTKKTVSGLSLEGEIVLVYLVSILGLVFAFIADDKIDERAKFAYKQSGAVFICSVVLSCFAVIPFIGLLFGIASFVLFVFTIVALIKGYQGEEFKIPVIYDLANLIWKK